MHIKVQIYKNFLCMIINKEIENQDYKNKPWLLSTRA